MDLIKFKFINVVSFIQGVSFVAAPNTAAYHTDSLYVPRQLQRWAHSQTNTQCSQVWRDSATVFSPAHCPQ